MGRAEDIFERIKIDGVSAIQEFIASRQSEELFLDFKRSSDNGSGSNLSQNDRNNLAKAISGFANSEGGVIVWGVDCSPDNANADIAKALVPLADAQRFKSWIEGAVSWSTVPPHSGVLSIAILDGSGPAGFVATLVPKSERAPHQMIAKKQYYIRAGSDFVPTPHDVLAGMFGRRPQPNVFQMFTSTPAELRGDSVHFEVGFMIHNKGPGIAEDVFITLIVISFGGKNSQIAFNPTDRQNWSGQWSLGRHLSLIAKPGQKLPPSAHFQPVTMEITTAPPFEATLKIKGTIGCAGAPPVEFVLENDIESIQQLYNEFVVGARYPMDNEERAKNFASKYLDIEKYRK